MSFLAGGSADCGPVNPMSGLLKQFQQDRSLQQVKLTPLMSIYYS
jgi:peroxin-5